MSNLRKPLVIALFCIITIFFIGIIGYHFIEGWGILDSIYMMVITFSTIGYGEVSPLSPYGRIFTMFLILFGVGTGAYVIQGIARLIIEGEFTKVIERQKLHRLLDKLNQHFIICGFGKVGRVVAEELEEASIPFIVVEKNEQECKELEEKGILVINGDATNDDILEKAGIDKAKGIVTTFPSDAANVYVVLTSREKNKDMLIISRCSHEDADKKLLRAGADKVISPYQIGALRMAMAITKPNVFGFLELITENRDLDLHIEEILIPRSSALHNVALKDSEIRGKLGIIIIAIKKCSGNMIFNPGSGEIMHEGDFLIALGDKEQLLALRNMVHEKTPEGLLGITTKLNLKDVCRYINLKNK